ncbi:MAG: ATP-binding protein [Candidatus Cloacimonetes bacterium]|nr:ATP-binding protein [Candidatus Cloacimonadota bacterium]MCF7869345.1 ATP-binding protein [Candidatus Cloacimonadota bacterium]MCF7884740.1 ATP-binding protein [Candidatus Cloacimonadota bacterium]
MFYRRALRQLEFWMQKKDRKPLILRGARQVGKTTLVRMFANKFERFVELNLELEEDRTIFSNNLSIQDIVQSISLQKNVLLINTKALIFIDEIQNSPLAISLLRYFHEEFKNLYIIAAGSLLEAVIGDQQISFPVGRVEYLFLFPVTFEEFLQAQKNEKMIKSFQKIPIPEFAHNILLKQFHKYVMLGGMPEVINNWLESNNILSLKTIYRSLMLSYHDDISKYARNKSMVDIIRHTIDSAPLEAGKRITFQGFGSSNYRSREIGEALRSLQNARIIDLIYPTTATELPMIPNKRKKPKLQFLDTGLINYSMGLFDQYLGIEDISTIYKGRIIEHIVGQELKVLLSENEQKLSFWVREKKQSQAEIDFIVSYKGKLIPIETKSGNEGKLRSLHLYMEKSDSEFAVRFYAGVLKKQKIKLSLGKEFKLLNLPYYLVGKLFHYLEYYV